MSRKTGAISIGLSVLLLGGGCTTPYSETPVAVNFATTKQNKLQAGAHWKAIAEDIAKTVAAKVPDKQPVFIAKPEQSHFNRAFFNEILTALVNQGVPVVKKADDAATTVDIETQLVKFGLDRPKYRTVGGPTALAATAWVIHEVGPHWSNGQVLAGAGALMVASDVATWFGSEYAAGAVPTHEIFVTVTASDRQRYLARTSNVYYVADSNAELYLAASSPKPNNIQLLGDR